MFRERVTCPVDDLILAFAEEDDLLARVEGERDCEEAGDDLDSSLGELGEVGLDVVGADDLAGGEQYGQLYLSLDELVASLLQLLRAEMIDDHEHLTRVVDLSDEL